MSVWGSTDTLGLTGDQQMDIPSDASSFPPPATSTFPGGFPTAAADPFGGGPSITGGPDLNLASSGPSTSGNGILALLSSLFSNNSSSGASGGILGGGLGGIGSGSKVGSLLSSLLGPMFGLNSSGAGTEGGEVGGVAGGALGSIFGPGGSLAGSAIGDLLGSLIGNWVGGGVPSEAKPEALVGTLDASGNPIEAELGKYIQNSGISQGYDLSESGKVPFNPTREADVLQLLGGTALPKSVTASGNFQHDPTLTGWKNLSELQGMDPNATDLNANQLDQIKGLIAHLVNQSGGQSLQKLLGEESGLASKLKAAETY